MAPPKHAAAFFAIHRRFPRMERTPTTGSAIHSRRPRAATVFCPASTHAVLVSNDIAMMQDSPESRKAVFRKLVDLYAAGDVSALDQIIAPNYVGHPSAGDRDLEGLRQSILYFHNLFVYTRDSFQIEDQLVDGEKVVTRMTANVRIRETGEPVTLLGINIARIVDGKLVEEWNTWEQTKATERLNPAALSA